MARKPINRWFLSVPGERAAGLLPAAATVDFPLPESADASDIEFTRETLKGCFAILWDNKRVTCISDVEHEEMCEREKEYGA